MTENGGRDASRASGAIDGYLRQLEHEFLQARSTRMAASWRLCAST